MVHTFDDWLADEPDEEYCAVCEALLTNQNYTPQLDKARSADPFGRFNEMCDQCIGAELEGVAHGG